MFALYANKNSLTVRQRERITSGSVNAYDVRFEFSPDWEGMMKQAVFRAGLNGKPLAAPWTEDGLCKIPWEVMTAPAVHVYAGIYGTRGEAVVLPTVWADLGSVLEGTSTGSAQLSLPDLWQQALAEKGDRLDYTPDGDLGLYAGDRLLSAVPVAGGGEEEPPYTFGHGLKQAGNVISVDTADGFDGDKTLPITAAAVEAAVGNIEILLETI